MNAPTKLEILTMRAVCLLMPFWPERDTAHVPSDPGIVMGAYHVSLNSNASARHDDSCARFLDMAIELAHTPGPLTVTVQS